jgi:hypothetical protein
MTLPADLATLPIRTSVRSPAANAVLRRSRLRVRRHLARRFRQPDRRRRITMAVSDFPLPVLTSIGVRYPKRVRLGSAVSRGRRPDLHARGAASRAGSPSSASRARAASRRDRESTPSSTRAAAPSDNGARPARGRESPGGRGRARRSLHSLIYFSVNSLALRHARDLPLNVVTHILNAKTRDAAAFRETTNLLTVHADARHGNFLKQVRRPHGALRVSGKRRLELGVAERVPERLH